MINTIKAIYVEAKNTDKKFPIYVISGIVIDILQVWVNATIIGLIIWLLAANEISKAVFVMSLYAGAIFLLHISKNYIFLKINVVGEKVDRGFNIRVFTNMLNLEYEKQEQEDTKQQYEFANTAINEVGIVKLTRQVMAIIESVVNVVIAGVALSFLNVWLVVAVSVAAGINVFSEIYRIKCQYEVNQQKSTIEWNMYYVRDYLSKDHFAKEIRILGMRDYVLGKLKYYIECYTHIFVEAEKRYLKKYGFAYVLDGLLLAVIYFFGIFEFVNGRIDIGEIAIYFSSMTAMVAAILNAAKNVTDLSENEPYMKSLQEFLEIREIEGGRTSCFPRESLAQKKGIIIEFDHVSFRYPGAEEDTLKNISFRINPGEKIAIVGKNGAGKTTLIHLLLRLYIPSEGRILINGVDYLSLPEEEIYELFSVVLQDFGIYPFSVSSNICMGEEEDVDRVAKCINMVGLGEKIQSLKHQKDTFLSRVLDEEGVELSGGEAQRLAMARAIYKDSPIMILDEPTAALSPKSEYDLYEKFKDISKEKTTLFISHKLAICRLCDRIIVLDGGTIERMDSHDELMKSDNLYSKMFRIQAESFNI